MTQRGPYRKRTVKAPPRFHFFKPAGVSMRTLDKISMSVDELEALRLADYRQLDHAEAAAKMAISRPTFTRLINQARQKVSRLLIDGSALVIVAGNVDFRETLHYCSDCGDLITQKVDTEVLNCSECGSVKTEDLATKYLLQQQTNMEIKGSPN